MHPKYHSLRATTGRAAGFSLIEVLVAAIVLATGLMALAALQASLTRGAADARARSQVASFVDLVIERQRAAAAGGFTAIPSSTVWTASELAAVQTSAGVSNLAVNVTATHYDGRTGAFVVCNAACGAAIPASAPQYKELRTVASWTDSAGNSRRYDMTSVVSPRTVTNSLTPLNTPTNPSAASIQPTVRTTIPSDAGIIPIAIGSDTNTAATNPKPKVSSGQVIRTSFEVLTYKTSGSSAVQQQRVETAVIGCKCKAGTAPATTNAQFGTPRWPAYWNGVRYVVYAPASNAAAPGTGKGIGKANGAVQDELCVECCRDHHDSQTTGEVKFDPFRFVASGGAAHSHFKRVNGVLEAAGADDVYEESCRMIRVDGFWRTAADFDNTYFNLLKTQNEADGFIPDATAKTNYQNMIKAYLDQRFTSGTAYNTALASTAVASLETTHSINDPTSISIDRTGDQKWLHSRGLYIDYLEKDALDAIAAAKAKTSCAGTAASGCVLPIVPFTTINLTELSEYASASTAQVTVENNGFSTSTLSATGSQEPIRGRVRSGTNAQPSVDTNVTTSMTKSNSGLAAIAAIDTADQATAQDIQTFTTSGAAPPDGTGGTFMVIISPYAFQGSSASYPKVAFTNAGGTDITCNRATSGTTIPNPYTCEASKLGIATTVKVTEYNYEAPTKIAYSIEATCSGNQVTLNCPVTGSDRRQCANWEVTSPAGGAVSGSLKPEATVVSYSTINVGDVITIGLTEGTPTPGPFFTCKLANGANATCGSAAVTWKDPCTGL